MADAYLHVNAVTVAFGGVRALEEAEVIAENGHITGLIGPNGAGKTTLLNVISGFVPPTSGGVTFKGKEIGGQAPNRISKYGILRTFQGTRAQAGMTVVENVMLGCHRLGASGLPGALFALPRARTEQKRFRTQALSVLERVGILDLADAYPAELAAGQLRLLEISRALAGEPELLLLDEPAAGLSRVESDSLESCLGQLRDDGLACILIEHDVELVLRLAEHVAVLDYGRIIATGTASEVRANQAVIDAYLGPAHGGVAEEHHD